MRQVRFNYAHTIGLMRGRGKHLIEYSKPVEQPGFIFEERWGFKFEKSFILEGLWRVEWG